MMINKKLLRELLRADLQKSKGKKGSVNDSMVFKKRYKTTKDLQR